DGSTETSLGTGASYVLTDSDVGTQILVKATYTDGHGQSESVLSSSASAVLNVNDEHTGQVLLQYDQTVSNNVSVLVELEDEDGITNISYQWQRDGIDIDNADSGNYKFDVNDIGKNVRVVVSYTDNYGNSNSVVSDEVVALPLALGFQNLQGDLDVSVDTELDNPELSLIDIKGSDSASEESVDAGYSSSGSISDQIDDETLLSILNKFDSSGDDYETEYWESREDNNKYKDINDTQKYSERVAILNSISMPDETSFQQFDNMMLPDSFLDDIDQMSSKIDRDFSEQERQGKVRSDVVAGVSASVTVGVVSWVLRAGSLLSSFLTVVPLWKQYDPLPILGGGAVSSKVGSTESNANSEEHREEEIFDHES
ncbi:MAG: hypothetical protein HRU20_29535, partial [Pseudomonadales bacterium]|nr:hypothetical protein [Pseudomonadales bacterium]